MPPGISDATLDIIRLVKRIKFLIITTSSQLAFATVRKLINLLSELKIPVIGVIKNMKMKASPSIKLQVERDGGHFWGEIPFDTKIEEAIGNINMFLETAFAKKLEQVISKNLKF